MAIFTRDGENLSARTLSQGYVFYEDLKHYHPILHGNVKNSLANLVSLPDNKSKMSAESIGRLRTMARNEFEAEKEFLFHTFGVKINLDLKERGAIKELTDAINSCISTEDIYKRLIARISTGQDAKIDISEFFTSYFSPEATIAARQTLAKCEDITDTNEILREFEHQLELATERALKKMFKSKAFNDNRNVDYENNKQEYSFLIDAIGKVKDSGSFANQVYHLYKLDEVKDALMEQLKDKAKLDAKTLREQTKIVAEKNSAQKKGGLKEYLTNLIITEVGKAKNVKVQSHVTGGTLVKPDVIAFFGIDGMDMIERIEREAFMNREENMRKIKEGYETLMSKFNGESAFIVYTNSKNYTLLKKEGNFGGFSAGASGDFATLQKILSRIQDPAAVATFFNAIKQLAKGAVGEGMSNLKEQAEHELASDIAYFLFDDYEVVGSKQTSSIKQLHVIDLDGLYMPLSVFLQLLANAYEDAEKSVLSNPSGIVNVTISSKSSITFDYPFPEAPSGGWQTKHWHQQREDANKWELAKITFLRDFEDFVMQYLK